MRTRISILLGVALLAATFVVFRAKREPVRIAVIDTGEHGAQVALEISARCPECKIIPIQISASGAAIRLSDIMKALEEALNLGAGVVNFSFGVVNASEADAALLRETIARALSRNVVLVAAAGLGVPNPFRPLPLAQLFPHSVGGLIVVGAARSLDAPDPLSNYGELLDLVVLQSDAPRAGFLNSSLASARVSGVVGKFLSKSRSVFTPAKIKELLKGAAQPAPPNLSPEDKGRMGAGALDIDAFQRTSGR
ncbi:S8 family serine peptidase [Bdellovibrionota bacterium FG-2]